MGFRYTFEAGDEPIETETASAEATSSRIRSLWPKEITSERHHEISDL